MAGSQGARSTFGVFLKPLADHFGVGRGDIGAVTLVVYLCYGIGQPWAGRWTDLVGGRLVIAAGLVVSGLAFLLMPHLPSVLTLAIFFGIAAGLGSGWSSAVPATATVARRFTGAGRGSALGVMNTGSSIGQLLVLPLTFLLATRAGWQVAGHAIGLLLLALAPFVWLGVGPTGEHPAEQRAPVGQDLRRLIRSPDFWLLVGPYSICGFTTLGFVETHVVALFSDEGVAAAVTGTALALIAVGNVAGTLLSGYLSDRWANGRVLAGLYAVRAVALLLLWGGRSPLVIGAFALIYGLVDFATIPPTSKQAAESFGAVRVGLTYGLISLAHQVGSAAGAWSAGALHDASGSYTAAIWLCIGLLVCAASASAVLGRRRASISGSLPPGSGGMPLEGL